jgi:hypothetical protein
MEGYDSWREITSGEDPYQGSVCPRRRVFHAIATSSAMYIKPPFLHNQNRKFE